MFDHTEHHAALLRDIAETLGLSPVRQLARAPGVSAVCRVTVRHNDQRTLDTVTTVIRSNTGVLLEMCYKGLHHFRLYDIRLA